MDSREKVLIASGVRKHYGGVRAVDDIDLEIRSGEVVALIGPNGAGKTTLFNIISGIVRPDSGDIVFRGIKVTGFPSWRMAELGVGRTFQNIRLFDDLTVAENIALARKGPALARLSREDAEDILAAVGLSEHASSRAGSLPYGLRRQVELGRALASRPKLLLLDEPCAGMNPPEAAGLSNSVLELANRGMSVLLIEHNMRVALAVAHRVVVMNFGRKIAEGTPEAVRNDDQVVEAYLGQSGGGSGA